MDACWAYDALHSFLFGVTDVVMKLLIGRPLSSNPYAILHLHSQRCNSRSTYALRLQNKYNLQSSGWQAKENGEGQESQSKLNDGDHQQPAQHFQCTPWKDDRLLLLQSCENDRYRLDVKPLPVFNQPMVKVIDDLLVRMEKPIHQPRLGPLAPPNCKDYYDTSLQQLRGWIGSQQHFLVSRCTELLSTAVQLILADIRPSEGLVQRGDEWANACQRWIDNSLLILEQRWDYPNGRALRTPAIDAELLGQCLREVGEFDHVSQHQIETAKQWNDTEGNCRCSRHSHTYSATYIFHWTWSNMPSKHAPYY